MGQSTNTSIFIVLCTRALLRLERTMNLLCHYREGEGEGEGRGGEGMGRGVEGRGGEGEGRGGGRGSPLSHFGDIFF